jgi:hypothetical protein
LEEFLDQERAPRIAERAAPHPRVDRSHRFLARGCDDDSLPRRETVRLEHDREGPAGHDPLRFFGGCRHLE